MTTHTLEHPAFTERRPETGAGTGKEVAKEASKALTVSLWTAQVFLAAMFLFAGLSKLLGPPQTDAIPLGLLTFIGFSEVAGAVGVLLPSLLRIRPLLAPLAATGLTIVMLLATLFHTVRGEIASMPIPLVIGAIAAFVAWGRFRRAPIAPRSEAGSLLP